jgi:hypothetical protein
MPKRVRSEGFIHCFFPFKSNVDWLYSKEVRTSLNSLALLVVNSKTWCYCSKWLRCSRTPWSWTVPEPRSSSCIFRYTPDHLSLDKSPNIWPLIYRWELDKLKSRWNKSVRTSTILTLLYQQFLHLLISQRDMSGPRLRALSNNRWSGGIIHRLYGPNGDSPKIGG